jgi:luciferase family oxidoreductase group 1
VNPPSSVLLSVLDLAPVSSGRTSSQALHESVRLAQHVDALGYHRLWVAEHHGMPGIASSAPPVLIAALAARTERIRVGSGGVMLPNHPPLVVAEQFGTLEGLYPGRIDLGIGRAPGTDQRTASLLRRGDGSELPQDLALVRAFFDGPVQGITAVPAAGNRPQVWLLGSSGYSAQLAGLLGLPFAFAHHFSGEHTLEALDLYRSTFRPGVLDAPYSMICASVLVSDSYDTARELALPGALSFVRLRQGQPGVLPSAEETAAHDWTPQERAFAEHRLDSQVLGSAAEVERGLKQLLADTAVEELMVTTVAHALEDRMRSYTLLAELAPRLDLTLADYQPRARQSASEGRSAPSVVSEP